MEYGIADRFTDLNRDIFKSVAIQSRVGGMNDWEWGLNSLDVAQFKKAMRDGTLITHHLKEPECYVLVAKLARVE